VLFVFDFVESLAKRMDVLIDGPVSVRLKVNGRILQSTNQSIKNRAIHQSIKNRAIHQSIKPAIHQPVKQSVEKFVHNQAIAP